MTEWSKITLLYLEDDVQTRTVLEKVISRKFPGVTVIVGGDGEEGLTLFEKHQPELVLTDIAMPNLDGTEMTRRLRKMDPGAFVIALSAYSPSECTSAEERLFDVCISKPVQFDVLLRAIASSLKGLKIGKGV